MENWETLTTSRKITTLFPKNTTVVESRFEVAIPLNMNISLANWADRRTSMMIFLKIQMQECRMPSEVMCYISVIDDTLNQQKYYVLKSLYHFDVFIIHNCSFFLNIHFTNSKYFSINDKRSPPFTPLSSFNKSKICMKCGQAMFSLFSFYRLYRYSVLIYYSVSIFSKLEPYTVVYSLGWSLKLYFIYKFIIIILSGNIP